MMTTPLLRPPLRSKRPLSPTASAFPTAAPHYTHQFRFENAGLGRWPGDARLSTDVTLNPTTYRPHVQSGPAQQQWRQHWQQPPPPRQQQQQPDGDSPAIGAMTRSFAAQMSIAPPSKRRRTCASLAPSSTTASALAVHAADDGVFYLAPCNPTVGTANIGNGAAHPEPRPPAMAGARRDQEWGVPVGGRPGDRPAVAGQPPHPPRSWLAAPAREHLDEGVHNTEIEIEMSGIDAQDDHDSDGSAGTDQRTRCPSRGYLHHGHEHGREAAEGEAAEAMAATMAVVRAQGASPGAWAWAPAPARAWAPPPQTLLIEMSALLVDLLTQLGADWFVADTGSWTKQMLVLVENATLRRWRALADPDGVFRCRFETGDGREVELQGAVHAFDRMTATGESTRVDLAVGVRRIGDATHTLRAPGRATPALTLPAVAGSDDPFAEFLSTSALASFDSGRRRSRSRSRSEFEFEFGSAASASVSAPPTAAAGTADGRGRAAPASPMSPTARRPEKQVKRPSPTHGTRVAWWTRPQQGLQQSQGGTGHAASHAVGHGFREEARAKRRVGSSPDASPDASAGQQWKRPRAATWSNRL